MSTSEPIVGFSKVVFSYGHNEVLHKISFQLNRGEVIGLLGPNGAGKTTTLKVIAGLRPSRNGHRCRGRLLPHPQFLAQPKFLDAL
jgi:ABC-type multidrug transport system ATPase subunit